MERAARLTARFVGCKEDRPGSRRGSMWCGFLIDQHSFTISEANLVSRSARPKHHLQPLPMSLDSFGLKIRNVKCFGDSEQGFTEIKPINITIGRNNSGKSTLLDALQYAVSQDTTSLSGHRGADPEVFICLPVATVEHLEQLSNNKQQVEQASRTRSFLPRDWALSRLRDKTIVLRQLRNHALEFVRFDDVSPDDDDLNNKIVSTIGGQLAGIIKSPLKSWRFLRLAADRDITPEDSNDDLNVSKNGKGLTNIVFQCQNVSRFDESRASVALLKAINDVCEPDASFTSIRALMSNVGLHRSEIHFEEPRKGRLPISQLGSGLKTVFAVMTLLHVVPFVPAMEKPLSRYIYAFEELENNLHPSVQRRLFSYLRRFALQNHCRFFITTHSNAVIDMFANEPDAQILHVTHDRLTSQVTRIETYGQAGRVLDDLGIHASDILQANAILWVEGPSDRIYLRKWIEIASKEELKEGVHYQCMPFGGSVNAHLSFDDPEVVVQLVSLLRINRHAVLLIDSDRESEADQLKKHTQRLQCEIEKQGGLAWVTEGREVENYIPQRLWASLFDNNPADYPDKYTSFIDTLHRTGSATKNFTKVGLAHEVVRNLTLDDIESNSDLAEKLAKICDKIREWNGLVAQ